MTKETLETLERLWHDLDPGPAPLDTLVNEGRHRVRVRRRTVLVAAAASVALVVGVTLLSQGSSDDDRRDLQPSGGTELTTTVRSGLIPEVDLLFDSAFSGPVAVWDARSSSLLYVTPAGYSSSCPPTASAQRTQSGGILLEVDSYSGRSICTADATRMTVRVRGIDAPPRVIRVDSDGKSMDVMVQNRGPLVRAGEPNQALEVGESGPMTVLLHCGLEYVQMGDETWRTVGDGPSPSTFSQVLTGTGTRTSTDTLVLTSPEAIDPIVFHPTRRTKPYVCQ